MVKILEKTNERAPSGVRGKKKKLAPILDAAIKQWTQRGTSGSQSMKNDTIYYLYMFISTKHMFLFVCQTQKRKI